MLVISIGCPAGIGPEVSVAAAARERSTPTVLVGDLETIRAAASLREVDRARIEPLNGQPTSKSKIYVVDPGPHLTKGDRRPGRPSKKAGAAQLRWVDEALRIAKEGGGALVTGPVSKAAIARSGARGSRAFTGHTEWLQKRTGSRHAVMCFASPKLVTSLATTHLPLSRVPNSLSVSKVEAAILHLAELLRALGHGTPRIAVASLNPHAGESGLLGREEERVIAPAVSRTARALRGTTVIHGPMGAETAYRRALAGDYDGVVAMYHDQATIPMKAVAFGEAVNVTMGLGIVRTSVDHGTGYDIAWQGAADAKGMRQALRVGALLLAR